MYKTLATVVSTYITISLMGCKSIPKKNATSPLSFPQNHSNIDWNELVKNEKDAETKKVFKSIEINSKSRVATDSSNSMSNPRIREMGASYLFNLHKTVPFEKVIHYREGLLARTKDRSFFFITPNPSALEQYKLEQTMVQMMSEHLYCFIRGKVESENLVAYRCKDGRVVKFLIKHDNMFTKVSAKAYENVKLEWLALESSFTGGVR